MKALKDRIIRDGKCFEGGILKVDNFINHQMDPILMKSMAVEFVRRFASTKINKILTIEPVVSLLPLWLAICWNFRLFLPRRKKPSTMENMLTTTVYSFTKDRTYDVCVSRIIYVRAIRCCSLMTSWPMAMPQRGLLTWYRKQKLN